MFDPSQKSTGTRYTPTVAFLTIAFVFCPAILFVTRPFGYISVSLAVVCSVVCVALGWRSWKRSSQLSVPSIESQGSSAN